MDGICFGKKGVHSRVDGSQTWIWRKNESALHVSTGDFLIDLSYKNRTARRKDIIIVVKQTGEDFQSKFTSTYTGIFQLSVRDTVGLCKR